MESAEREGRLRHGSEAIQAAKEPFHREACSNSLSLAPEDFEQDGKVGGESWY